MKIDLTLEEVNAILSILGDLTQEEVNAILTILGDMPTKTGVFPLVMKIKVQADALIAAEQKEQEAAQ